MAGGKNNMRELLRKKRIIDTFPAAHLGRPDGLNLPDSLSEYSVRTEYGLEIARRRRKRKKKFVF